MALNNNAPKNCDWIPAEELQQKIEQDERGASAFPKASYAPSSSLKNLSDALAGKAPAPHPQQPYSFKDSGQRQQFNTGAVRDVEEGKGRLDMLPQAALLLLSMVYEKGCQKYGDRNWEKGIPMMRYLDSAQRHIGKYISGFRDEPHLSMATWNLMCALQTAAWIEMGLRPRSLYDVPNNFVIAADGVSVLSAIEREYLCKWMPQGERELAAMPTR